jgi:hypothetical protein
MNQFKIIMMDVVFSDKIKKGIISQLLTGRRHNNELQGRGLKAPQGVEREN